MNELPPESFAPGTIVEVAGVAHYHLPPIGAQGIVLDPNSPEVVPYKLYVGDIVYVYFDGFRMPPWADEGRNFLILDKTMLRPVSALQLLAQAADED